MAYNFSEFKENSKGVEEWLKRECSTIRTGRATPAILDGVRVESYGMEMPVSQVATISLEGPRTLRVTPWDQTLVKVIEKALVDSDLGLSVAVDDKGIRLSFPELTSERRVGFVKIAKQKLEDARVTLRTEREKVLKDIETQEKDGAISEDEKFRTKAELQKMVDQANLSLDEVFNKKEKEISE